MNYPPEFPNRLKPTVAAAIARAQLKFTNDSDRIRDAIFSIAETSCKAAEEQEWRVDLALEGLDAFLRVVCDHFGYGSYPYHVHSDWFLQATKNNIKESKEWLGYLERLEALAETQAGPPNAEGHSALGTRKEAVLRILEEKGWSILDWASEADVAYHTAADYLSGKKNPFRSTRAKLAKALGVPVNSLPE